MAETTVLRHNGSPQRPGNASPTGAAGVQTSGPLPMVNVAMGGAGGKVPVVNGAGGAPQSNSVVILPMKGYRGAAPVVIGPDGQPMDAPQTGVGAFGAPPQGMKVEVFNHGRGAYGAPVALAPQAQRTPAQVPATLPPPPFTAEQLTLMHDAISERIAADPDVAPTELELRTLDAIDEEQKLLAALADRAAENAAAEAARAQAAPARAQVSALAGAPPPLVIASGGNRSGSTAASEVPRRVTRRQAAAPPVRDTTPGDGGTYLGETRE